MAAPVTFERMVLVKSCDYKENKRQGTAEFLKDIVKPAGKESLVICGELQRFITFIEGGHKGYKIGPQMPCEGFYHQNPKHVSVSKDLLYLDNSNVVHLIRDFNKEDGNPARTSFSTSNSTSSCAKIDNQFIYVSDPKQATIFKYNLNGVAVKIINFPIVKEPSLLIGDSSRRRLFVFENKTNNLHSLVDDELVWSQRIPSLYHPVRVSIRDSDGLIFAISDKGKEVKKYDGLVSTKSIMQLFTLCPTTGK